MNKFLVGLCVVMHLLFVGKCIAADIPIGVGDEILIVVFNEPDLTVDIKVGESGNIKMPLIGELLVDGKTPDDLAEELTVILGDDYLVSPQVSVSIKTFRPFYIKGEVTRAGAYEYVIGLTVDQAIAIAGGLDERAAKGSWFIVRGIEKKRIAVDSESVVLPGDIIEIPESFF